MADQCIRAVSPSKLIISISTQCGVVSSSRQDSVAGIAAIEEIISRSASQIVPTSATIEFDIEIEVTGNRDPIVSTVTTGNDLIRYGVRAVELIIQTRDHSTAAAVAEDKSIRNVIALCDQIAIVIHKNW